MKERMTVEQYDNGIGIKIEDCETGGIEAIVALDMDIERTLGRLLWQSIKCAMEREMENVTVVELNYNQKIENINGDESSSEG